MLKINPLKLPDELPAISALRSWGQSTDSYKPETWEMEYQVARFLKNVDDDALAQRYKDICRNFTVLARKESNVIPINTFLSSWYWYRKEHLTRYEIMLRRNSLPTIPPTQRSEVYAPVRPKWPNSGTVLFRYGEAEFMKRFVENGEIRISPASVYKDGDEAHPRTDDELNKHQWLAGHHTTIQTSDGIRIPIIGDVKETISTLNNYYTLCTALEFEPVIFKEFDYDACVLIKDTKAFAKRIELAFMNKFPQWYFHHNPVEYYDPYERYPNQYFEPTMCKDFRFAYQMEYRFIWNSFGQGEAKDYTVINVGALDDICELHYAK